MIATQVPAVTRCRICGSEKVKPFFHRGGREFVKCQSCKSVIAALTFEQYIALSPTYDAGPEVESVDRSTLRRFLAIEEKVKFLRRFQSRVPRAARVLDVGCGAGGFLLAAKELGWNAVGVEPSHSHSTIARALGFDVREGYFRAADFPTNAFDLVMLSHVIEHIYDPRAFIAELVSVTRPGGVIVIITPNAGSLASYFGSRFWVMYKPVDHVSMLAPPALEALKPKDTMITWWTSEYPGEILTSLLAALRDGIQERRGHPTRHCVPSNPSSAGGGCECQRTFFRRRAMRLVALGSWPLHLIAKLTHRQACLVVQLEKQHSRTA